MCVCVCGCGEIRASNVLAENSRTSKFSLGCGMVIGLPPVLHFGKAELIGKVVPEVLSGKKTICLSITEYIGELDCACR